MNGVPEITAATFKEIAIDRTELTPFEQDRVHRIRSSDIFVGPLVVVHKSPPAITGRIGVTISEADAVFNETFYGYSPGAFADSVGLTRYLLLILGSQLAIWFALVTSGEVGIEREIVEKATLDRIPLPDFRNFGVARRDEIDAPYEGLRAGVTSWNEVDKWVTRLYGLGPRDLQVVSDTLEFNLPYARNKRRAQAAPTKREQARFCEILEQELRPWCARFGSTIDVRPSVRHAMSPWYGLQLRTVGPSGTSASSTDDWQGLLRAADDAAASEILLRDGPTGMLAHRPASATALLERNTGPTTRPAHRLVSFRSAARAGARMRPASVRSSPDQVAELTRGLRLLLPEVSSVHLEIISEGILRAFNEVRAHSLTTVGSGCEAEVTALIEARLNMLIEEDPLWRQLVLCVARGKESLSFDG